MRNAIAILHRDVTAAPWFVALLLLVVTTHGRLIRQERVEGEETLIAVGQGI